jgi:Rrf2 family protein
VKLTTKTRYGTRAMLDLALHYGQGPLLSAAIAQQQNLSTKYLEQLLSQLRNAGLVRSTRGAHGGHALSRSPEQIDLRQIYEVFEGRQGLVDCVGCPQACERHDHCVTREVWSELYSACTALLERTTLADLVHRAQAKQDEPPSNYVL